MDAGSSAHTECFYASGIDYLRITNSHFYRCAVMDVFITRYLGTDIDAQHGWIENNVFEKPSSKLGKVGSGYAFHFRNGPVEPAPDLYDWDFRYNTFAGPLSLGDSANVVQPSGLRVTGNISLAGATCRTTNSTYSFNVYAGGTCGGSNELASTASALNAGFVGPTVQEGDAGNNFRLALGSPATDKGNIGTYPSTDQDGYGRYVGLKPDAGAFEYGAVPSSGAIPPNTTITTSPTTSTPVTRGVPAPGAAISTNVCVGRAAGKRTLVVRGVVRNRQANRRTRLSGRVRRERRRRSIARLRVSVRRAGRLALRRRSSGVFAAGSFTSRCGCRAGRSASRQVVRCG